ncbi:MAG: anaerobic ribonucleoside-triphosphate reductase, partial [Cellulosilyticum sp.]|nr:anaerobic ribonucleoside-triphosphate reductase [Cellulosilyticum sp.]
MQVRKRDGSLQEFDKNKIAQAIIKANNDTEAYYKIYEGDIDAMVDEIIAEVIPPLHRSESDYEVLVDIEEIQDAVELCLQREGYYVLAKNYIKYRYQRELARAFGKRDESILSLIRGTNDELRTENSNKNVTLASTQRDYMAGEVAKDLAQRLLLPKHIVDAHNNGVLHFHDMDYSPAQPLFNCCLINIGDMLDNGTCVNGTKIDSPSSFPTACTIVTQIIASVASGQYGGQSVNVKHLGKYLKRSYDKYNRMFEHRDLAWALMMKDLHDGVQTIQYQINTISCTNGQTPFVTLFLELDPKDEYLPYTAMIIEEILQQRIKGVKNEVGAWVTPTFPKLVYVLDECNNLSGGEYDYLTHLAAECTAKRMYPDYISAKKMREHYQGNVFSPMGCRSFLSPWKDADGEYKFEGRFNQGVVTINLPQIALEVMPHINWTVEGMTEEQIWERDLDFFKEELDHRLQLCFDALMCRHKALLGTKSDISPIHWQHGAIARLGKGEVIDPLLFGYYSTISLGYIGLYEVTKLMTGEQHTSG